MRSDEGTGAAAGLSLRGVGKRYGALDALSAVDLDAAPGEIVAVTGPSGAGKTTLCRLISGLERATAGSLAIAGRPVTHLPAQARDVAYMFESYALYPHLSVFDNVASPLRAPRQRGRHDAAAIAARVGEVLALTEMEAFAARRPAELSGGQKQRVALCRALVQEPAAMLLDEPLSHLDAKLRHRLRGVLRRRLAGGRAPVVWCTPDGLEALSVADRIAVLVAGEVQQIGAPQEVYRKPANLAVARLLGDPAMNLLRGRLEAAGEGLLFRHAGGPLPLPAPAPGAATRLRSAEAECVLGIRPTALWLRSSADGDAGGRAEVYTIEPFGKYSIVTLRFGGDLLKVKTSEAVGVAAGETVSLGLTTPDYTIFSARTGAAL